MPLRRCQFSRRPYSLVYPCTFNNKLTLCGRGLYGPGIVVASLVVSIAETRDTPCGAMCAFVEVGASPLSVQPVMYLSEMANVILCNKQRMRRNVSKGTVNSQ